MKMEAEGLISADAPIRLRDEVARILAPGGVHYIASHRTTGPRFLPLHVVLFFGSQIEDRLIELLLVHMPFELIREQELALTHGNCSLHDKNTYHDEHSGFISGVPITFDRAKILVDHGVSRVIVHSHSTSAQILDFQEYLEKHQKLILRIRRALCAVYAALKRRGLSRDLVLFIMKAGDMSNVRTWKQK